MNYLSEFYDELYPLRFQKPYSPEDNAIEQRIMMIYGPQCSGKTTATISYIEEAVRRYGLRNVNAITTKHDLTPLLIAGFGVLPHKPINIFSVEDLNSKTLIPDTLQTFFNIRHFMAEKTNYRAGLMILAFSTHSLFSMPKDFRTNVNVFVAKGIPNTPYDKTMFRKYIPDTYKKMLQEQNARVRNSGFAYNITVSDEKIGVCQLERPTENYMRSIEYRIKRQQGFGYGRYGRAGSGKIIYTCEVHKSPFEMKEAKPLSDTYTNVIQT